MAFNYTRKNAYDYDTVKKAQADLNANSTYNKSETVLAAERLKNEHAANKVADWTGGLYGEALKNQMDKINNREKFNYDLNGDALYQQYKDQYINQGRLAMQDAMGQAAAMTGGYGNSYAETVGNQAYQGYLSKLNEVVPELYQMAWNKYNQEEQDMKDVYAMLKNSYDTEYGEYRDKVSDWTVEQNRLDQNAYNEAQLDYSKFADNRKHYSDLYNTALTWATNDANTDYSNRFSAYQQKVSEDQYAKKLAAERAANDQSKTIASLQAQLKVSNLFNAVRSAATITRGGRGNTGNGGYDYNGKRYSSYDAAYKAATNDIGKAYNGGEIDDSTANTLLDLLDEKLKK